MGWLRRMTGVIFAAAVAIGTGLVIVPAAVLADPVTRAASFALAQYAVLALETDVPFRLDDNDFIVLAHFLWMSAVMVCAVPVVIVAAIGETAKVRALLWYAIATGILAATAPWLIRVTLHLPRAGEYNAAEMRFALVFFIGGTISGSVYWLLAGRTASGRAER